MKDYLYDILKKTGKSAELSFTGINNLIKRSAGDSLSPTKIVYMVSDRCNSRCIHCNIWRTEPAKNPLSPMEVKSVFSDELFRNVNYVLCTGGEPSIRNDLKEIILNIHRALPEATIQLSTNGLLPERVVEVVNAALKRGISLEVGVSLDGLGEVHDKIRGNKGSFQKADWLIRKLIDLRENDKNKLHIAAGIVLSDLTMDSLYEVRTYAKRLEIDLTEAWYNESLFYDNIGKNAFNNQLIEAVKSQPPSPVKDLWLKALKGRSIKFSCFAMYSFCVLKANGDMVPCLNLWNTKAGNVRESSPGEIWHSDDAKKARQDVKECKGCLNSWGAGWSLASIYYPLLLYYLKHPRLAIDKLRQK